MDQSKLSEDQQRVLWYVRLRWSAVALVTIVVLYLKLVGRFNVSLPPLLTLIALICLYNLIYPFFVARFKKFSERVVFTDLRTLIDLAVITLLIHFTGGVESPFILLYLLELMAISLFDFSTSAYYLAALASIFYLVNGLLESYFIVPHYRLSPFSGTLFMTHDYILALSFSLFFSSALLIFMASYLADKFVTKQKEIEELSNSKVLFMNEVMHETKSPLTSIIGYAEILLRGTFGNVSEAQTNPLQVIRRQSKRILDMVNNLLDIARLESGLTKIEKKPVKITDTINSVLEEMKPELEAKELELVQEAAPNLPVINIDEAKISEVITNLICNAEKFSKTGGKIYCSTQTLPNQVQIAVRDEGLGIDPEDLPHIFEKFHRASKEACAVKGTGLGLALSKTIVEAHGGRMWAESKGPGKGAVFYFTLPL